MRRILPILLLLACKGDDPGPEPAPEPEPGALTVGVARVRMPVPVGIGTAGYGGFGVSAEPSPFSQIYPATTRVHTHPDLRAIAISRGEGFEAIFLRIDAVGVFQQLRRAVVLELQDRLGRDLDHALVIGATHTHSGPGRVIDAGGPFELIADRFHPEFYEALVGAMADAVEQAIADQAPGRLGFATAYTVEGISDRRCEDGLTYENGTLPVVAVEREGELAAVMLAYPIHGTVLGIGDLTLSQDASGGIEAAVEDRLGAPGAPVMAMMMNSWGADMSPRDPGLPLVEGAELPGGYERIEAVGQVVADAVQDVSSELSWTETPDVRLHTHRTRIDRDVMGYAAGEFTFDHGAVYCGAAVEADCDPSTSEYPTFDDACIPFNETFPAPDQTELTVGRLGPLAVLTFPGEPGTLLAEHIVEQVQAAGADEVLFLGYAQDYLGYSLLEDDWWQGGYEASGAIWGPRQGEYLAGQVVAAWQASFAGGPPLSEPPPIEPFGGKEFTPYSPTPPEDLGEILVDAEPTYGPADTVEIVVAGADPWLGTPLATLVDESGAPVLRDGGLPIDSDGLGLYVELVPDPPYADDLAPPSRTFRWVYRMPVAHRVPGVLPTLSGTYRIAVSLPTADGPLEVTSAPFQIDGE